MTTKRDSSKLIFKAIVTLNYRSATPPGRLSSSLKTLLRCETLQALSAQVALKELKSSCSISCCFSPSSSTLSMSEDSPSESSSNTSTPGKEGSGSSSESNSCSATNSGSNSSP
ncbi:hypothetical protein OIU76_006758 [Salix suchowensis]|nr:hypothetical protein OIU76_006758 [Salix suchowensis]